jgi:RAD51-like protein 2
MSRNILLHPTLPSSTQLALRRAGYETLDDLSNTSVEALSKKLGIDISDSQSIITASQRPPGPPLSQSLASLISRSQIFACSYAAVNTALGGGLPRGHILEISGPPGSFKESLALDYARIFVEANEEVIFIDTQNMTSLATIKKTFYNSSAAADYQDLIRYTHLHTLPDLMIFIHNLRSEIHTKTGLLVLNSISFPFLSHPDVQSSKRTALLEKIHQVFLQASALNNLTIITTSQMSTKLLNADGSPGNFETGAKAVMTPQLGSSYLPNGRSYRLVIVPESRTTGVVQLLSSPTHPSGQARHQYDLSQHGA